MAWIAEVTAKSMLDNGGCQVTVVFYDDTKKDSTSTTRVFNWTPGTTGAEALADVRAAGGDIRDKYTLFDAITIGQKVTL